MSTIVLGDGNFEDSIIPLKGKTEWGMDTLIRKMTGARSLAESFMATLAQGQFFQGYYLQSWEPDDNPIVATITLYYKGLFTGGTPQPKPINEVVSAIGQVTKDFSTELDANQIQGRKYRHDLLWSVTAPSTPGDILGTSLKGFRDRYAVFARMDFAYEAAQTTYKYIATGRPSGPRYSLINFNFVPTIERARISLNDGTVLPRLNWQQFFELNPQVIDRAISFRAEPVIGSPYFECEDVVRRTLGDPLEV